jgi:hypothetical protein
MIQNSICQKNNATMSGGCLFIQNNVNVTIRDTSMNYNKAKYGGAMYVTESSSIYYFGTNKMTFNIAKVVGGAIVFYHTNATIMYDKNGFIQLDSNHADRGSAIYLYKSVLNIEERNSNTSINDKKIDIYLTNNHASIAGTIYWIYDNDIMRSTPNVGNIKFIKNQASYGHQMATQAVNITGDDIYEIINYDKFIITALDFKAFDYYGQALENIPDDSFSFSASITTKHQCLGRTPTITRS